MPVTTGAGAPLPRRRFDRLTIRTRIFLLVGSAILATALAFIAISRFGPPPFDFPTRIDQIAAALTTGHSDTPPPIRLERPSRGEPHPLPMPRRPLAVERTTTAPRPRSGETPDARLAALVRARIPPPPGEIRAWSHSAIFPAPPGPGPHAERPRDVLGDFTIARRAGQGWIVVRSQPSENVARWRWTVALTTGTILLVLTLLGWRVARRIARPLSDLADAARDAQAGHRWAYEPAGASPEVRAVASALAAYDRRHREHFRRQSALLAGIAHDLGTPLARLAFRVEALPDSQRTAAMQDIEHMRKLIAASISMARSSEVKRERVDMSALLRGLAERAATGEAPILARVAPDLWVMGEPTSLTRLVQNLLDNACNYAGGGRLRAERHGDRLIIHVEDDGPGIAPDRLATICEPFVRENAKDASGGGNGLGLAIARSVVERHGGDIRVENRTPHGLCVTVELPLSSEPGAPEQPDETADAAR